MSFSVSSPFELAWNIRISDMQVDIGKIKFDHLIDSTSFVGDETEGADENTIGVVEVSASWKNFALPIFINDMILSDRPWSPDDLPQNIPVYDEASFTLTVPGRDTAIAWADMVPIYWSLKGCGFGQYYLHTVGGTPHLDNECMNKGTILKVFQEIILPQGTSA